MVHVEARLEREAERSVHLLRGRSHVLEAVVDATEDAALNALWAAPEVIGREGRVGRALPHDDVLELLAPHGRLHP